MAGAGFAVRGVDQLIEDAAIGDAMATRAPGVKLGQLLLERFQGPALRMHARQMLADEATTAAIKAPITRLPSVQWTTENAM
jgi:hypothetical protein